MIYNDHNALIVSLFRCPASTGPRRPPGPVPGRCSPSERTSRDDEAEVVTRLGN